MIPSTSFQRRIAIAAAMLLGYSILCTQLPLFHTLGYEFAALTGLVISFCVPIVMARSTEDWRDGFSLRSYFTSLAVIEALLLIPFLTLLINANFVRNCSLATGALFYVLIPVVTGAFTLALFYFTTHFFGTWRTPAYYATLILLVTHPCIVIYTQPQLYAYNHLFGMFIGLSWDESQPMISILATYRVTSIAYAALLLSVAQVLSLRGKFSQQTPRQKIIVGISASVSVCIILVGLFFSDAFGFTSSHAFTRETLGAMLRTKHFDIYYSKESFSGDEIDAMGEEHEFRLHQVLEALRISAVPRMQSYIYPDRATKKRLLGSETSQIAKPWRREMYLVYSGWEESLKHEIVHLVAAQFAPYIVKAPVIHHYGLVEGLAMAIEWEYGSRTLHEYAAGLRAYGMLPRVEDFIATQGFMHHASTMSYVVSGSFCRWLIDTHGVERMKKIYAEDDFVSEFPDGFASLEKEWIRFLDKLPRALPDSIAIRYLFGGTSLFRKECARVLTEMNRNAAAYRRAGKFLEAAELFRKVEGTAPSASAVMGAAYSYFYAGWNDSVLAIASRYVRDEQRSASLAPLYLLNAHALSRAHRLDEAKTQYDLLIRENITESMTGEALRWREILEHTDLPEKIWTVFFAAMQHARSDSTEARTIDALRNLFRIDSTSAGLRLMLAERLSIRKESRAEALGLLSSHVGNTGLANEMGMLRGTLLYESGDVSGARKVFASMKSLSLSPSRHHAISDWIERCAWKGTQKNERDVLSTP